MKLAPAHQATAEPKFTSNRHQQAIMQAQFSSTQYWESCHNDVIAVWTMDSDFSTAWHTKFYDRQRSRLWNAAASIRKC